MKPVRRLKAEYSRNRLNEKNAARNPFTQFKLWFKAALLHSTGEANAMALATVDSRGKPSNRMVLLKHFAPHGFFFFTNYESRKASELEKNPHAALLFYWPELERQVRIEGKVTKISTRESAQYFRSRPRGSQVSACISPQSKEILGADELELRAKSFEARFADQVIPCPEFWGGYQLKPTYFEFWQGCPNRLHDRLAYHRSRSGWRRVRLAP
jgi:pyridoxamine 5'-phosphate oxidase